MTAFQIKLTLFLLFFLSGSLFSAELPVEDRLETSQQSEVKKEVEVQGLLTFYQWRSHQIQIAINNIVKIKANVERYKGIKSSGANPIKASLELMAANPLKYPKAGRMLKELNQAELHLAVVRKLGPEDYFDLYLEGHLSDPRMDYLLTKLQPAVVKKILQVLSRKDKPQVPSESPKKPILSKSAMR